MTRATALRCGGITFVAAYLGIVVACWGDGRLATGSPAGGTHALAWTLLLASVPAGAIGLATWAACRRRSAEAAPRLLLGVVSAVVLVLAALQLAFRMADAFAR